MIPNEERVWLVMLHQAGQEANNLIRGIAVRAIDAGYAVDPDIPDLFEALHAVSGMASAIGVPDAFSWWQ